jgi:hypothetical protein
MDVNAVLGLIDGAIEAWEVSGDAMRWTPEPVEPPDGLPEISFGFDFTPIDQHYRTIAGGWFWEAIARELPRLGEGLTQLVAELEQGSFTPSEPIRRLYLNDEVPSGLSRATDPGSTERGTT